MRSAIGEDGNSQFINFEYKVEFSLLFSKTITIKIIFFLYISLELIKTNSMKTRNSTFFAILF